MKIEAITGTAIPLFYDDIDTDRIIPARYLKEISFKNMGKYAFYDERFDTTGVKKNHPFNDPRFNNGSILLVGKNFGCGSSREHAPQALQRFGITAIIGESFAEIFAGNCKALGLPTIVAAEPDIAACVAYIKKRPHSQLMINLVSKRVRYFEESFPLYLPDSQRASFINGHWNVLSLLKQNNDRIAKLSRSLPYLNR